MPKYGNSSWSLVTTATPATDSPEFCPLVEAPLWPILFLAPAYISTDAHRHPRPHLHAHTPEMPVSGGYKRPSTHTISSINTPVSPLPRRFHVLPSRPFQFLSLVCYLLFGSPQVFWPTIALLPRPPTFLLLLQELLDARWIIDVLKISRVPSIKTEFWWMLSSVYISLQLPLQRLPLWKKIVLSKLIPFKIIRQYC